jgi:protein phosphatase
VCGRTDPGRTRGENQDFFLTADVALHLRLDRAVDVHVPDGPAPTLGRILLVADGMGGQAAGAEASKLAAQTFLGALLDRASQAVRRGYSVQKEMRPLLSSCLFECHRQVLRAGHSDPRKAGMGTTLTAGVLLGTQLFTAHVGDSRCYLLRGGNLTQLTRDHTFVQWCVDHHAMSPADAEASRMGHILWNAIGGHSDKLAPEVGQTAVTPGDVMLLCTDGLTRHVSTADIAEILQRFDLESAMQELIDAANFAGGSDNVTVLAARVGPEPPEVELQRTGSELSAGRR